VKADLLQPEGAVRPAACGLLLPKI